MQRVSIVGIFTLSVTAEKKAGIALAVNIQRISPTPMPGRQSSHKKFKFKLFRGVTGM